MEARHAGSVVVTRIELTLVTARAPSTRNVPPAAPLDDVLRVRSMVAARIARV